MNEETFRSRLLLLLQKSRKAVRLYSNVVRHDLSCGSERDNEDYAGQYHVEQWREVNHDLCGSLKALLETPSGRSLTAGAFALRDRYHAEWRMTEVDLHVQHKELIDTAERSDFMKVASLAKSLVALKARVQALQAVHHELQLILARSNVSQSPISLVSPTQDAVQLRVTEVAAKTAANETNNPGLARIIPLRRISAGLH